MRNGKCMTNKYRKFDGSNSIRELSLEIVGGGGGGSHIFFPNFFLMI